MRPVVLDAFALIALLRDEPAADAVEALLRDDELTMPAINLAEAWDVLRRVDRVDERRLAAVMSPLLADRVQIVPVGERLAREAAELRLRHYHRSRSPLSLADCVLLAAAGDAAVATADRPLARAARAEGLEVIGLPDQRGRRP